MRFTNLLTYLGASHESPPVVSVHGN